MLLNRQILTTLDKAHAPLSEMDQTRFDSKIVVGLVIPANMITPCHLWKDKTDTHGHPRFILNNISVMSQRIAFELFYKTRIPATSWIKQLKMLCGNTECVNPQHMKLCTPRESVLLSPLNITTRNHNKQFCKNSHELTKENTYIFKGRRYCKLCCTTRNRIARNKTKSQG